VAHVPADNITDWEREKEKEEFVKIANDFKKVPDSMASRFQSAGKLGTTSPPTHDATHDTCHTHDAHDTRPRPRAHTHTTHAHAHTHTHRTTW
jgi:hypothetical protein